MTASAGANKDSTNLSRKRKRSVSSANDMEALAAQVQTASRDLAIAQQEFVTLVVDLCFETYSSPVPTHTCSLLSKSGLTRSRLSRQQASCHHRGMRFDRIGALISSLSLK